MFFLLFACVQDLSRPYLGDCAQHPEGNYDYGQIGIGTCLAGPSDILFLQEGDTTKLLISNANPYLNFETGSLLVVEWDSIDETESTIYSHELSSQMLPIKNFSGELESNGDWVTLSNRYSEEARDLEQVDRLLQFSFSENTLIQEDDVIVGADYQF